MKFIQDFLTALYGIFFFKDCYRPDGSQQQLPHQQHVEAAEVYCRPTFFHRTPLVVASKHEIQAPTLTAGIEQEDKFRGSPDNENTNEEEENSTKQTTNLQRVN